MRYVALLRGINVGGANKVEMGELKAAFEAAGLAGARTYINSGNVVFASKATERGELAGSIERAIERRFGFPVSVLVRDVEQIRSVVAAIPDGWANDAAAKCDVFFLFDDVDSPAVLDRLAWDPEVDDVRYTPGAVIRHVARADAARSKLTRVVGTPLYQRMTARNFNTARRLLRMLEE